MSTLARRFANLLPRPFLRHLEQQIAFAGFPESVEIWVGSRFIMLLMYALLGGAAAGAFTNFSDPVAVAGGMAATIFTVLLLVYLNLYYQILARTRNLERMLSDFLLLIAANLRAGMTPFGSFVKAMRPEFGELYVEGRRAAASIGGKRSLEDALNYLATRFDSPLFKRSLALFVKGVHSGSQLARLLTTNAEEIRKIQDLRQELVATTRTYMIFIAFVVVAVMPFLLSVSAFFLQVFAQIQAQVNFEDAATAGVPLLIGELGITPDEVKELSILALVGTSILASAFMGIIRTGRWVYGVKYFPFMVVASVLFFFLAERALGQIIQLS